MIIIAVGHSRIGDEGATSVSGLSEWKYNQPLARNICTGLRGHGIANKMVDYYPYKSYTSAMRWLSEVCKQYDAKAILELHFNSSNNPESHGFEYLFWYTSKRGGALAKSICQAHAVADPDAKNRGIKPIHKGQRGAQFLRETPCPAVICEPFFGSNEDEWEEWEDSHQRLANIILAGILSWENL